MAVNITGTVFNDKNHNGIFDGTDTGISSVYVCLQNPSGTCVNVQTNTSGLYTFSGLTTPGKYTIFETVIIPNACPPTSFTQPMGFNDSTTARQLSITITASQIAAGTTLSGNNFGHDNLTSFGAQSFAWQVAVPSGQTASNLNRIDLRTGATTAVLTVNPAHNLNAMGYAYADGNLYGWDSTAQQAFRLTPDGIVLDFATIPNMVVQTYNTGDVNINNYLYLYIANGTNFYTIDVNPNRSTFMQLVVPSNGFVMATIPFGTPVSQIMSIGDWAFNPNDNFLYAALNASPFTCVRVNPTTGAVTQLTTTGTTPPASSSFGGSFFDSHNNLYESDNTTGTIYKYTIAGNTATVSAFSNGLPSTSNDGARDPLTPINFADITSGKTATYQVGIGDTITYTITLANIGNTTASNVVVIDTMPNGVIYNSGSAKLDNTPITGSPVPPSGITVGTLSLGVHTLTFTATASTIPNPNPTANIASGTYTYLDTPYTIVYSGGFNTNIASTTVVYAILNSVKSESESYGNIGDTVTYSIAMTNTGTVTANTITFIDSIPIGTTFINSTLKQDNINILGNPNPPGVSLPNSIGPNLTSTITFSVKVNTTLPTVNPIPNTSSGVFSYNGNTITPTTIINNGTNSNTVFLQINNANLSAITKSTNLAYADCGSIITYTINIPNSGNVTAQNIIFKDTIPNGTSFVVNSVYVNGIQQLGYTPQLGITIPNIAPSSLGTLSFQVKVQC